MPGLSLAAAAVVLALLIAPARAQMPPEVQADLLAVKLEAAVTAGDRQAAATHLKALKPLANSTEKGFWFKQGKALAARKWHAEAKMAIETYLARVGRDGAYYKQALALFAQVSKQATAEAAKRQEVAKAAPEPSLATFDVSPSDEQRTALKNANVRAAPSAKSAKLGRFDKGAMVRVTGRTSIKGATWYRVDLADGAPGFVYGTLLGLPAEESQAAKSPPTPPPVDREMVFWQSVQDSREVEDYEAYLRQYPQGTFVALAEARIKKYTEPPEPAPEPVPAPAVTEQAAVPSPDTSQKQDADVAPMDPRVGEIISAAADAVEAAADSPHFSSGIAMIAYVQAKAGDVDGARQNIERALRLASTNTFGMANANVATAQTILGDVDAGLRTARQHQSRATGTSVFALMQMVQVRALVGDQQGARRIIDELIRDADAIENAQMRVTGQYAVAAAWASLGDMAAARSVIQGMANSQMKSYALTSVAEAQNRKGDPGAARQTLDDALQSAAALDNDYQRSSALGSVAQSLARIGERDLAQRTVDDASRISESLDSAMRDFGLVAVAAAQAMAYDAETGLRTANDIATEGARNSALLQIASGRAEAGDVTGALDTAKSISDDFFRGSALAGIAILIVDKWQRDRQAKKGN